MLDSFNKTLSERRKQAAIDKIQALKYQMDLGKERIAVFQSEIAQIQEEMQTWKNEIVALFKEHFLKDEYE